MSYWDALPVVVPKGHTSEDAPQEDVLQEDALQDSIDRIRKARELAVERLKRRYESAEPIRYKLRLGDTIIIQEGHPCVPF